jgi:Na+-transporting NADH:ubiquinone oxidoreductase subunit C
MSSNIKSFIFAFVMCCVVGLLLTLAAEGLKPLQARNMLVDQQKNILRALGIMQSTDKWSKDQVLAVYTNTVESIYVDAAGSLVEQPSDADLPMYVIRDGASIQRYAIPFKAYGLWSWIHGYIALDGDASTVVGMSVYKHAETPGLGGECDKPWFLNQFIDKKIRKPNGQLVSVGVVKGKVADTIASDQQAYYVDGMSGATITGVGIERDLRTTLQQYEGFASALLKEKQS